MFLRPNTNAVWLPGKNDIKDFNKLPKNVFYVKMTKPSYDRTHTHKASVLSNHHHPVAQPLLHLDAKYTENLQRDLMGDTCANFCWTFVSSSAQAMESKAKWSNGATFQTIRALKPMWTWLRPSPQNTKKGVFPILCWTRFMNQTKPHPQHYNIK